MRGPQGIPCLILTSPFTHPVPLGAGVMSFSKEEGGLLHSILAQDSLFLVKDIIERPKLFVFSL